MKPSSRVSLWIAAFVVFGGCKECQQGVIPNDSDPPATHRDAAVERDGALDEVDAATPSRDASVPLDAAPRADGSTRDAAIVDARVADAAPDAATPTFEVLTTSRDSGLIFERIRYRSSGLAILGWLVRPDNTGVHPAIIYNHGGGGGITINDIPVIKTLAQAGTLVFASEYRGEGGSEGTIETCLGEVDDVIVLTEIARAHPLVDETHVAMVGGSHGGCITMRAVQKGARVQSAVPLFPATDAVRLYHFYDEQAALAAGRGDTARAADYAARRDGFVITCGGTPDEQPACYAARSATLHPGELGARTDVDIMLIHGVRDALIHYSDSCDFVTREDSFTSYRISSTNEVLTASPAGCEGVTFSAPPLPMPDWGAHHTFVLFDALEHGTNLESTGALGLMYQYLASRLF